MSSPPAPPGAPFFSTEAAEQLAGQRQPQQEDAAAASDRSPLPSTGAQEVQTFVSTMQDTFQAADKDAENDDDGNAQELETGEPSQSAGSGAGGRKQGAMKWNGLELRALLRAMDARNVFDPVSLNADADHRARAWLHVVDDLNQWNRSNPRKDGKVPVRTAESCESKWRKDLLPKIKEGMRASEIATGPSENNEEEELTDIMERLKEQWEQGIQEKSKQREAKKKAKDPAAAKSIDARSRATQGEVEDDADEDNSTDSEAEQPALKRRRGRGASGAAQLAGTVDTLAKSQSKLAEKDRVLKERIHNEQQGFRDRQLTLEERKLQVEEANVQRLQTLETQVQQSLNASQATLQYLQRHLPPSQP